LKFQDAAGYSHQKMAGIHLGSSPLPSQPVGIAAKETPVERHLGTRSLDLAAGGKRGISHLKKPDHPFMGRVPHREAALPRHESPLGSDFHAMDGPILAGPSASQATRSLSQVSDPLKVFQAQGSLLDGDPLAILR
jgi:hypothetical protein